MRSTHSGRASRLRAAAADTAASALPGKPFTVLVSSYANANGKRSPAVGVQVGAGSVSATTKAGGTATLSLSQPGNVTIAVSAPHAIRDETTVCIHKPGVPCPGS